MILFPSNSISTRQIFSDIISYYIKLICQKLLFLCIQSYFDVFMQINEVDFPLDNYVFQVPVGPGEVRFVVSVFMLDVRATTGIVDIPETAFLAISKIHLHVGTECKDLTISKEVYFYYGLSYIVAPTNREHFTMMSIYILLYHLQRHCSLTFDKTCRLLCSNCFFFRLILGNM